MKRILITLSILLSVLTGFARQIAAQNKGAQSTVSDVTAQSIRIILPANAGPVAQRASEIPAHEITERSGAKVSTKGNADYTIELAVAPGIGTEGFTIASIGSGKVKITGNDENGLFYGVGKFLHTSRYSQGGFTPGTWRGTDIPQGAMRGIYFATHFNNWYETVPDEELQHYAESLALWGTNALTVHFPLWFYKDFNDPKAKAWIAKARKLMACGKKAGMQVGLLHEVNSGFTSSPENIRVKNTDRLWGDVLICPAQPHATELLLNDWKQLLNQFKDIGLDFVVYWPYDEGGCDCDQCKPWGSNGFPKLCKEYSTVTREVFPGAKFVLSTWLFDMPGKDNHTHIPLKTDGEYAGLDRLLQKEKSWVDYIQSDAHEEFPPYPLRVRVPGNLPLLNFPEISMYGQWPCWGGYGATPLHNRLQKQWDGTEGKVSGGFPYSEGIYEDVDKVICSQFYWNAKKTARTTLEEYIAYEFSPDVVNLVTEAMDILEENHFKRMTIEKKYQPGNNFRYGYFKEGSRIEFANEFHTVRQSAAKADSLMKQADSKLTPVVKSSWRWRLLSLRTTIDNELARNNGWLQGPALQNAFAELTRWYHGDSACIMVHVPRIENPDTLFADQELLDLYHWKFKTGDNLEWARPDFDDTNWKPIEAGSHWEEHGYAGYDGYAWYRIRFTLPSELKKKINTGTVCISLGKIDDHDQTFLNGKLLGQNAKIIPATNNTIEELSKTTDGMGCRP